MNMATKSASMTVRGIDERISSALKDKARRDGVSVNALTLRIIREGLGLERKKRKAVYDDLDYLAGTWSDKDVSDFEQATAVFEIVDEDLWK
jgi:plasmid stability protein